MSVDVQKDEVKIPCTEIECMRRMTLALERLAFLGEENLKMMVEVTRKLDDVANELSGISVDMGMPTAGGRGG